MGHKQTVQKQMRSLQIPSIAMSVLAKRRSVKSIFLSFSSLFISTSKILYVVDGQLLEQSSRKIIFIFGLFSPKEGICSPYFWPLCCYFFNNEENKLVKPPTAMKHQDHTDFMNNRFLLMCFEKIWLLPFLCYFIWQTGKR